MKNLFIIISLFFNISIFADDSIGVPAEDCNCQNNESQVLQVVERIAETNVVIPIEINYKLLKVGKGHLSISHIDGKILSAQITGEIKLLGFNEKMTDVIEIDQLKQGKSIRYYSNLNETPIVEVTSKNLEDNGGTFSLKIKQRYSTNDIPLEITYSNGKFIAKSNGSKLNSLRIYFDLDYGRSAREQEIIGGYISSYKLR